MLSWLISALNCRPAHAVGEKDLVLSMPIMTAPSLILGREACTAQPLHLAPCLSLRLYTCHPPGLHRSLFYLWPFLYPPRPGGVFPTPVFCGKALRTLPHHPEAALPLAGAVWAAEGGMAGHTPFHGDIRPLFSQRTFQNARIF